MLRFDKNNLLFLVWQNRDYDGLLSNLRPLISFKCRNTISLIFRHSSMGNNEGRKRKKKERRKINIFFVSTTLAQFKATE